MNIKMDFLPVSASNRPGRSLTPTYITQHETGNTRAGADAEVHARYIKGADARSRSVSWHYTVDDKQIIQHLPTNEVAWHAGPSGNSQSIGIELCVNSDGDFQKAKENAAWLIQHLMQNLKIPLSRVVTHKHWTGKNCPARLLNEWTEFKNLIGTVSSGPVTGGVEVPAPTPTPTPQPPRPVTNQFIANAQTFLNSRSYPSKASFAPLVVDGIAGPRTTNALVRVYQYFASVSIDGIFGPRSKRAANTLRRGSTHQWWVRLLQSALNVKGARIAIDGSFGPATENAVRSFQRSSRITVDGIAGPNTWEKLLT
ncbi:peptidoglycan recognition protein family protein [Alkalicoccobacillus porphyridii]|uniref:N-acetylmuramoyl-L-alanine amidase n=1 Tax=Alkalicoccobacillus porphyridii TaxID=2597270 RepID=A0A553ZV22_9BACI|nr:N-acetylmuramoyl-L-alanine amidase [Alkalicoccobacillus porphyridii]TSB45334.1 N-acetylmuramoyl-L-alanine amidase [Alkalicoccobacillus porphyridii]